MGADVVSDCFGRVMSAVTQATTSILAVAGQYQTRLEELEEAEMRRRIAADPLVCSFVVVSRDHPVDTR